MSNYTLSLLISARDAASPAITSLRQNLSKLNKEMSVSGLSAALGRGFSAGGWTGMISNTIGLLGQLGKAGGSAFGVLGTAASMALGPITGGATIAMTALSSLASGGIGLVTSGLKYMGIAAAGAMTATYGLIKALQPAGQMEGFRLQLETMLGSADKAQERLQFFIDYAKKTPFELPQLVEAANLMEAFGIYSKRNLDAAGNAAAMFGKDIREVVTSLNYLASGRGGEAFESLARLGITRDKIRPYGIQFTKSQELISSPAEAFDAVIKYIESRFNNGMERQAKTLSGVLSNLSDSAFFAFARAGQGLLKYVKPAIETVSSFITSIGDRLEKFDWSRIGTSILTGVKAAESVINRLLDPKQRAADIQMITGKDGLIATLTGGIGSIMKGVFSDGAATLATVFSNLPTYLSLGFEVMRGVFGWAWAGLKEILEGAWDSLGRRVKDFYGELNPFSKAGKEVSEAKSAAAKRVDETGIGKELEAARNRLYFSSTKENRQAVTDLELKRSRMIDDEFSKNRNYQIQTPGLNGLSVAMSEQGLSAAQSALKGAASQFSYDIVTKNTQAAISGLSSELTRFTSVFTGIIAQARGQAETILNPAKPQRRLPIAPRQPIGLIGEGDGMKPAAQAIRDVENRIEIQKNQLEKLSKIEQEMMILNSGFQRLNQSMSSVASYIAGVA